jgi:hypothetical protein
MQRPRVLHESIPRVIGELGLNGELRGFREAKRAVQLPKSINPEASAVREKVVA